jgi:cytochrome c556
MKTVMVIMVFALMLMYAMTAVAHEEGEESGSGMKMDTKMKMQHRTMGVIAEHWGETQKALKEKDWKEAGGDVAEIVEAAEELKEFKPHRNADKTEYFMKIQGVFVKRLTDLGKAIETKDGAAADRLAGTVQKSCNQCHAMFR